MVRQAYSSLQKRTKDLSELLRRNQFWELRNGDVMVLVGAKNSSKNLTIDFLESGTYC